MSIELRTNSESPPPRELRSAHLAGSCVLAVAFFVCYSGTLLGLAADWWNDPNYSFGILTPFAIAYIVVLRRKSLMAEVSSPNTTAGLVLILLSQLMFLAGDLGAEFFLQRSSMVVLFAGTILYLVGWPTLKRLLLPLLLLELCIPLPSVLFQKISMPLQLVSSSGAGLILRSLGFSVYRNGNILELPHQTLSVGEACSGIRFLSSMLALALILISTSRLTWWVRASFVASAAVVAIAANALRITGAGLMGEYFGHHATYGVWHSMEGWFVFILSFSILSLELALLNRWMSANRQESAP